MAEEKQPRTEMDLNDNFIVVDTSIGKFRILGLDKDRALLANETGTIVTINRVEYKSVCFRLKFIDNGWKHETMNSRQPEMTRNKEFGGDPTDASRNTCGAILYAVWCALPNEQRQTLLVKGGLIQANNKLVNLECKRTALMKEWQDITAQMGEVQTIEAQLIEAELALLPAKR